jgi:hypothetical protein
VITLAECSLNQSGLAEEGTKVQNLWRLKNLQRLEAAKVPEEEQSRLEERKDEDKQLSYLQK